MVAVLYNDEGASLVREAELFRSRVESVYRYRVEVVVGYNVEDMLLDIVKTSDPDMLLNIPWMILNNV